MADPAASLPLSSQHIFHGGRLAAFSDAVFSIIATFSVIPLKFSRGIVLKEGGYRHFNLEDYLFDQWPKYLVYLYSFALVADVWFIHCGVFSIVEKVDDPINWLNLLLLFIVSFVPYATGLISNYASSLDSEQIAISICAGVIFCFSINLIIILSYAFRRQSLLHPHLINNNNIRKIKVAIYIALLVEPILSVVAIGFSFLTDDAPWLPLILFYSILPVSLLVKLGLYLAFNCKNFIERVPAMFSIRHMASKSRAEAFSDGVFAIVATLIVLDLTTENIPERSEDGNQDLQGGLYKQRFVFLSYVTTFMITGLLWFVQYSMFHFIKTLTPALSVTNTCSLFLIGGIPFASEILSVFSDETFADMPILTPNKILCIRVFSVVVMLAGLLQLLFWCVAHHQKKHCMSDEIDCRRTEIYMFLKIMIIPITGLVVYWGTFSKTFVDNHLYTVLALLTPVLFILLRICMRPQTRCRAKKKKLKKKISPSIQTSPERVESPLLENRSPILEASMQLQATKDVFV